MDVVEKVSLPAGTLIANVPFRDYVDAFRVGVDAGRVPDVDTFARAFVDGMPSWVAALMRTRDAAVGLLGLKRSIDAPPSVRPDEPIAAGAFLAFVRVLDRDGDEILAGEDDRHLDFRVSFLYGRAAESPDGTASVTLTTVVRFHNALGRAYFVPVAPMHRRITRAMLSKTATDLMRDSALRGT